MKLLLILVIAAAAHAQGPAFEVASVKANKSESARHLSFEVSPQRLSAHNTFFGMLIMRAYGIDETQFPKGSAPLLERYDVDAKTDHSVSRAEMMRMLQTLLADRFKLAFHWDTRDVDGYALVAAKGGPKLRKHERRTIRRMQDASGEGWPLRLDELLDGGACQFPTTLRDGGPLHHGAESLHCRRDPSGRTL
jgi:uncharacterized protein (TIGR03435 family)